MYSLEQTKILKELSFYITFLTRAVSAKAAPVFCELLIGSMLSGEGFLTQALLAIQYDKVWSSYHHWVAFGCWHWRNLAHQLTLLVSSKAPEEEPIPVILDDLTLERCSENAPACRIHRQHSQKKNRAKYILGQCWVFLAIAFKRPSDGVNTAVPVMAFPAPKSGNVSKLKIARCMLTSLRKTLAHRTIRILTDSWFMNKTMMLPALVQEFEIIGNIPKNRALFALPVEALPPSPINKRGRKRIYGVKMTPEEVQKLPETTMTLRLYGKERDVAFRSCICRARFLKGRIVRVVWSSFVNDKGKTECRLFLSTNPELKASEILEIYSMRWPIEPMFQQMKYQFGCKNLWQQKLRTLLRWMHIKMAGYALLQLLTICMNTVALKVARIDWRKMDTVTAGMVRQALKLIIPRFTIRGCWNRYEQKLELISNNQHERTLSSKPRAA